MADRGARSEKAKKKRVSDTGEGENLSQQKRRKVPKFAMGEKPQSEEDFMYENFRVCVKNALEIIRANPELTAVEYPKAIYINLSDEYGFIFDRLKSEKNAFPFEPLVLNEALQDGISLAVYGGFYLKKYNKANNL